MSLVAGARSVAGAAGENPYPIMCKIELPPVGGNGGDDQYGGTRVISSAYMFSVDKQIGEGTYGQVFMGTDKQSKSNDKVALKKIRMDTEKEGFPITAIREIKILSTLQHENVVNLREIVRSDIHKNNNFKGSIYMVFDYADYDLTGLMETVKYKFTEAQVKCIMKQLLKGLAYVHSNGVLHRDLKASNILIDSQGIVKLADFGLARTYQEGRQEGRLTNRVITLWYRPPELLLGADRYGPEIDMWSVGCIFAELLVGKPIFPGKDETDQVDQIFKITGTPNEQTWPGVSKYPFWDKVPKDRHKSNQLRKWIKDTAARHNVAPIKDDAVVLLEKMLTLDPAKRVTALDAFKDQWFWSDPMPCDPKHLPCGGSSHEFTMKKRRNEEKEREEARAAQARSGTHAGGYYADSKRPRYSSGVGPGQPQRGQAPTYHHGQQAGAVPGAGYRPGQAPSHYPGAAPPLGAVPPPAAGARPGAPMPSTAYRPPPPVAGGARAGYDARAAPTAAAPAPYPGQAAAYAAQPAAYAYGQPQPHTAYAPAPPYAAYPPGSMPPPSHIPSAYSQATTYSAQQPQRPPMPQPYPGAHPPASRPGASSAQPGWSQTQKR